MRRQVAGSLRRYPSSESVQALIPLLDDGDARVAEVAQSSLATATGANVPADAERWRDWLEYEEKWLANDWPAVEAELGAGGLQEVLRSLALLGRKRVHGSVVARAIATAMHHPRPEIRIAACEALERLGTPLGQADARELVADDPDPRVKASARRVLVRMGVAP
jgi:HEAT repeat protein